MIRRMKQLAVVWFIVGSFYATVQISRGFRGLQKHGFKGELNQPDARHYSFEQNSVTDYLNILVSLLILLFSVLPLRSLANEHPSSRDSTEYILVFETRHSSDSAADTRHSSGSPLDASGSLGDMRRSSGSDGDFLGSAAQLAVPGDPSPSPA